MSSIARFFNAIDLFGANIQLNYKKKPSLKTTFGGVITTFFGVLTLLLFYVFGKDIVLRQNPNIKFTRLFHNFSDVAMNDFPVAFHISEPPMFSNLVGLDLSRVLDLQVVGMSIGFPKRGKDGGNENSEVNIFDPTAYNQSSIEKCDQEKHFGKYKDNFLQASIPSKNFFCVQHNKNNTFISNDYFSENSTNMAVVMSACNNSTRTEKNCYSQNVIDKALEVLMVRVYYLDSSINPYDYHNPVQYKVNNYFSWAMGGGFRFYTFTVQNTEFVRDDGLVTDSPETFSVKQLSSVSNENFDVLSSKPGFLVLTFATSRSSDYYFRSYLKLTELIGFLGGMLNVLFIIGVYFCRYFAETSFYLKEAHDLVNYCSLITGQNQRFGEDGSFNEHDEQHESTVPAQVALTSPRHNHVTKSPREEDKKINLVIDENHTNAALAEAENLQAITSKKLKAVNPSYFIKNDKGKQEELQILQAINTTLHKKHSDVSKSSHKKEQKLEEGSCSLDHPRGGQGNRTSVILQKVIAHSTKKIKREDITFCGKLSVFYCNGNAKVVCDFYEALIDYFKSHLSIEKLIKTKIDLIVLKKLVLGGKKDFEKVFQIKIPLESILNEVELYREDEANENLEEEVKDEEDVDVQNDIRRTFKSMITNAAKKKIFEDTDNETSSRRGD